MTQPPKRGAPTGNRNAAKEEGLSKRLPPIRITEAMYTALVTKARGLRLSDYLRQLIEKDVSE